MNKLKTIWIIALLGLIVSCSQEKNTIINRSYHNLTARYNGYFNGRLALQEAHLEMAEGYEEDYSMLLPMYISDKDAAVQPVYPKLDRAIEKTSLVVGRHSMDIKGKEYCKWIDETWIIMGEAQYLKGDYIQAKQIFDFTKRKYPDEETKQWSYFWLARLYIAQEQYERAGDEIRRVTVEDGFPEKQLSELYALKTDFYIKQGRFDDAITELERSIELTRKRQVKTRRMFILAQLLRMEGDGGRSSDLYKEIIKRNPPYEMAFYAKINRALAYDVTAGNTDEIKEILFKMIKDEKNAEYLDQIYYALAELELKEGNEAQGIDYLKLATQKSVKNGNAKGLAYYRLADIYFEKPNYPIAQTYYDSTVAFLSTEHPDYDMVLARANSLTQMMRDINIVSEQDSLQAFAQLPKKEQERTIEQAIEDLIQAEKDAEREQQLKEMQAQQSKFDQNNQINRNINKGEWYFYNPAAVGFGAAEFKKIWGNRKNQDDWRRSDKTSNAPLLLEDENGELAEDTIDGADDPKNPNFYWKSVPDTDEKLVRSHALIIEALYDLALVYKEQMNDWPKSAETFEELIARYDTSKYHTSTHYQLYLMYDKMGKPAKSEWHKEQVLLKYPDSDYAKVIQNPNYAVEGNQKEEEIQDAYARAYGLFEEEYYKEAYGLAAEGLKQYPSNPYQPQFEFLQALCLGFIDSEARMISALEEIKANYGNTEVGKEAADLLEYFKNGRNLSSQVEESQQKLEEEEIAEVIKGYTYDIGASHNFVLLAKDTHDIQTIQSRVSDFNRTYFSTKGFKTTMIPINDGINMIVVSNVGYVSKAMDYYNTFTEASEETKRLISAGMPAFVISFDNYAEFYKNQNIEAYEQFFQENYIKTD